MVNRLSGPTKTKYALLSYSGIHFDPERNVRQTSSAGVIAAGIYDSLIASGYRVDYISPDMTDRIHPPYDLFIGQPTNWYVLSRLSKAKRKILFMPTSHPFRRNSAVRSEAAKRNVPVEDDITEGPKTWRAFMEADLILQIGNQAACEILIRTGVHPGKIVQIHYGISHIPIAKGKRRVNLDSYLHLATNLGLRKGFPAVVEIFSRTPSKKLAFMGRLDSKYWRILLRKSLSKNNRWSYIPWIDSSDTEYRKKISAYAWLVFPTIEDVEPGVLQETMRAGLVPLIESDSCGIDFSIDGNFSMNVNQQVYKSFNINSKSYQSLSLKVRRFIAIFHDQNTFQLRLTDIWRRLEQGKLGPDMTVISFRKGKIYSGHFQLSAVTSEINNKYELSEGQKALKNIETDFVVLDPKIPDRKREILLTRIISWMEQHPKIGLVGCDKISGIVSGEFKQVRHKEKFIWETESVSGFPLVMRKQLFESFINEQAFTGNDSGTLLSLICRRKGLYIFYYPETKFRLKKRKPDLPGREFSLIHIPKPRWGAYWDPRSSLTKFADSVRYKSYQLICIFRLMKFKLNSAFR